MSIEQQIYKLKTDGEFKRLIPQLAESEREQLEKNIIQDGCRDAICVWFKTIVDGHNRYEICTRHKIPFAIKQMSFPNRALAMVWICANQLGRRNIDNKTRQYLIGKRYEMEKIIGAHNSTGNNQYFGKVVRVQNGHEPKNDDYIRTSERIGEEYDVGATSVRRYSVYAQAIDELAELVPGLHEKLMSGKLKITQQDIIKLAQLPPAEIQQVIAEFSENPTRRIDFSETSAPVPIPKNMPLKDKLEMLQFGAVKNMPEYDPDAEISSLALTVPSWTSSINRVRSNTKFNEVSDNACERLTKAFDELKTAIAQMILTIEERK